MGEADVGCMTGPLAPYAAGFRENLVRQGFVPGTASDHLRTMAQLSRWLVSQSLDVGDLTPAAVCGNIFSAVDVFTRGVAQYDDQTVLVAKVV